MENAAEALKMAFAVLVFVIALSLGFRMISQARATADVVYATTDKQDYVDGTTAMTRVPGNTYRIVGLDTVIPTIYRYAQENYAVTIIEGNTIKARFDLQTERVVSSEFNTGENYKNLINGSADVKSLTDRISDGTNGDVNLSIADYDNLFTTLYKIDGANKPFTPWTSSQYNIMRRLKKDIYGGTDLTYFNTDVNGTGINGYDGVFGSHGLIGTYSNKTFKEYYYAIKEKNNLTEEEETKKLEIIYVVQ